MEIDKHMKYHTSVKLGEKEERIRDVPIRNKGATVLAAIFWTMLVVSTGVYVSWYFGSRRKAISIPEQGVAPARSAEAYIAAVAQKIILPKDQKPPRVAVISDPDALTQEQDFYRGAEAGDVLMIFEGSRRAIIYSPRRDIIVNVGPIVPRTTDTSSLQTEYLDEGVGGQ